MGKWGYNLQPVLIVVITLFITGMSPLCIHLRTLLHHGGFFVVVLGFQLFNGRQFYCQLTRRFVCNLYPYRLWLSRVASKMNSEQFRWSEILFEPYCTRCLLRSFWEDSWNNKKSIEEAQVKLWLAGMMSRPKLPHFWHHCRATAIASMCLFAKTVPFQQGC